MKEGNNKNKENGKQKIRIKKQGRKANLKADLTTTTKHNY